MCGDICSMRMICICARNKNYNIISAAFHSLLLISNDGRRNKLALSSTLCVSVSEKRSPRKSGQYSNDDEEHTKTKMHDETLLNNGCDATEFRYGTLKIESCI